jgi:multiple sugar transport system permease protein
MSGKRIQQIGVTLFAILLAFFFLAPLLWFIFAPFDPTPSLSVTIPERFSLDNFTTVISNTVAMRSLLINSPIIGGGVMLLVAVAASLAAYGLSRGTLPGRSLLTYILILFSSVVTGTASMVPIFVLIYNLGLFNTYQGVILTMAGGLLPTSIFIMQDFVDGMPRSYEEAAMVSGATPLQIFRDVALPVLRPGIMVVAILAFVGAWGAFLTPLILIRNANMRPAAIAFYQFYGEEGNPNIPAIAAYALLYTLPVLLLYLLINWRYGFRFFGGVKQ